MIRITIFMDSTNEKFEIEWKRWGFFCVRPRSSSIEMVVRTSKRFHRYRRFKFKANKLLPMASRAPVCAFVYSRALQEAHKKYAYINVLHVHAA